jgi:hypothetical protein
MQDISARNPAGSMVGGMTSEPAAGAITGPQRLTVRLTSGMGPLARRSGTVALRPRRFAVVNSGRAPCTIASCTIDPPQVTDTGTTLAAELRLTSIDPDADSALAPGGHAIFQLAGAAPSLPGAYASTVRIASDDCATLAIPIALEVAASPLWGIGAMFLGLVFLGLVNLLAQQGDIKGQLHDALAARQGIRAWLDANPAPQSRAGDMATMDRDYDAAIASLSARRPLSVVDHRATEAAAPLKAADTIADQLRHDLAAQPRGAAEIADLTSEWTALQALLQQIAAASAPPAGATSAAPAPDLAGRLDAFLLRYRGRFLQQPIAWISDEATGEIARVRLAYAAGEGETARDLALAARSWMRRSARALNTGLVGYRQALVMAGAMVATDTVLRARVARRDFPDTDRATIIEMLDAASAAMEGSAWLPQWAEANRQINLARTALARAGAEQMKRRSADAIAAADAATDTSDIEHAIDALQQASDHSLAAKQAGLAKVLDLWRAHIATVDDAETKAKLLASVDAIAALVTAGDLKPTGPLYRILGEDWVAWNARLVSTARDQAQHQVCLDMFADLQRDTSGIEASLRERPSGPDLTGWDRRLDQIRLDMQRQGPDAETISAECMTPLIALGQRVNDLSGEILTTTIVDLQVPALTRIRLAETSGLTAAMAATEANSAHARALDLDLAAFDEDRVVERPLTFAIGRLDPVWGAGVAVGIDFGDGAPPVVATAERLRQGFAVTHAYTSPRTVHAAVVAAKEFTPGTINPVGSTLGEGHATILIRPSPVSRAQALADDFLNLRFALALIVALTVYFWRYHSKTAIFGARGFDYVEAFALGFVANAAMTRLPEAVAALAPS